MHNLVITIGRQNGSGGRYIGEKVAEALGVHCYDSDIVVETAKQSGLELGYLEKYDEKRQASPFYFGGQPVPDPMLMEEWKTIEVIAARESCVFIGRCSDYVLRDHPNVLNIFVHAPLGARIERVCKRKGLDVAAAEKLISRTDEERERYYNLCTQQKWGEATNYALSLDTSRIRLDSSVDVIMQYIRAAAE